MRLTQPSLQPYASSTGQPALAKPREASPDARDAFKPERFDGFISNVRNRFLHGISRIDQASIGGGNHSVLLHLVNETDQFSPIIGPHDHDRKVFDFPSLNQGDRFE